MRVYRYFAVLLIALLFSASAYAKTAAEIDAQSNKVLKTLDKEIQKSTTFTKDDIKGILVFPSIIKAGIGIGGEYGEGVLRVGGKSIQYYNTTSASIGFQLGAQKKACVILFMTNKALEDFRDKSGWQVGIDGSIALIDIGAGTDINSETFNKPVIGFMFDNKGLMCNLTLEGSKFTKIKR